MNLSKSIEFFNPTKVKERVHIIGCGAAGSTIAELLARAGLSKVTLYDFDKVEPHNIANQMFKDSDIGRNKAEAVKDMMVDINPDANGIEVVREGYTNQRLSGYIFLMVDNIDLRYEWYMGGEQAKGDQVSLAAFYKHFDAPIEWTYTVAGGTDLIYSYQNARQAHSYGLELDLRKGLGFIGLPDWSLVFNGSLIKSRVRFAEGSRQKDRPMQGQSPYLVNAGLFYQHKAWTATILYNIIGKRLIGVGRSLGSTGDQTVNIPDSYEMPRHSLDLSFGHDFGPLQLRISGKDIVGQAVCFKQFNSVTKADGTTKEVEEVTRRYRPGRTFSVALSWKF